MDSSMWDHYRSVMKEFIPNVQDQQVSTALKKLIIFSLLIVFIPLLSMFVAKKFIFEGIFHFSSGDSIFYAAIIAIVLVHVVLAFFVYTAWNEDTTSGKRATEPKDSTEKVD